ncbi:hypothetical protein Sjap_019003 [Stephania japonica]|uniref:GTD-binding domain-containing protein n=1 Tax=Stephania japonica TaxID=461633 RepID=A0AAP0EYM6_9MAGN
MVETSVCQGMTANEIFALKEEILNQKQHVQQLYSELDAERECSSTSASESLSMILRLQGELAVEKMESSQYRRLSESRIRHAEESATVFEDLLYWKEMEIASLKYQVQAYRYKMLSMGFSDLVIGDMKFSDHLTMPFAEDHNGNIFGLSAVRRNNSVPPFRFEDTIYEVDNVDKPINSTSELLEKNAYSEVDSEYDQMSQDRHKLPKEHDVGITKTHWKKIRQLVEQVKLLSQGEGPNVHDRREDPECVLSSQGSQPSIFVYSDGFTAGPRSSLLCPEQTRDPMSDTVSKVTGSEVKLKDAFMYLHSLSDDLTHLLDLNKYDDLNLRAKRIIDAKSVSFHYKFDVPQTLKSNEFYGIQEEEVFSLEREKLILSDAQSKSLKPSDEATGAYHLTVANPPAGAFSPQTTFQWHTEQSRQFKDESGILKAEVSGGAMQQFMVYIKQKINIMRSGKRSVQAAKCPSYEYALDSLMELLLLAGNAMLLSIDHLSFGTSIVGTFLWKGGSNPDVKQYGDVKLGHLFIL